MQFQQYISENSGEVIDSVCVGCEFIDSVCVVSVKLVGVKNLLTQVTKVGGSVSKS